MKTYQVTFTYGNFDTEKEAIAFYDQFASYRYQLDNKSIVPGLIGGNISEVALDD